MGGYFFYRLQPSNCKGFKNMNLVISSKKGPFRRAVLFLCMYPLEQAGLKVVGQEGSWCCRCNNPESGYNFDATLKVDTER